MVFDIHITNVIAPNQSAGLTPNNDVTMSGLPPNDVIRIYPAFSCPLLLRPLASIWTGDERVFV